MDKKFQLISLAIKYSGDYNKIIKAINNNEYYELSNDQCFTIFDSVYPSCLLELKNPPFVLFYKGNLDLLKEEKIGVVGSRMPCEYALEATKRLCLKQKDKVVVSGLAKGIDAYAHYYAGKTIGILGCGIDYIYPACNKELYKKIENEGLILSEYPGLSTPYGYNFPFRNRIIAALSKEVYIMEAHDKSGTLTTINEALELGKDVKVLPYDLLNIKGKYNNYLIQEGSNIISYDEITN